MMRAAFHHWSLILATALVGLACPAQAEDLAPKDAKVEPPPAAVAAPVPPPAAEAAAPAAGEAAPPADPAAPQKTKVDLDKLPQETRMVNPGQGDWKGSIMFSMPDITKIRRLVDILRQGQLPQLDDDTDDLTKEVAVTPKAPEPEIGRIQVSSIVMFKPDDWAVWINGKRITPRNKETLKQLRINAVYPTYVDLTWMPLLMDSVIKRWEMNAPKPKKAKDIKIDAQIKPDASAPAMPAAPASGKEEEIDLNTLLVAETSNDDVRGDVTLDRNKQEVRMLLHTNQYFDPEKMAVVEGMNPNLAPLAAAPAKSSTAATISSPGAAGAPDAKAVFIPPPPQPDAGIKVDETRALADKLISKYNSIGSALPGKQ